MPKLKTVMPETHIENSFTLQDAITGLDITRNQFVALHKTLTQYLPAQITIAQRTPKSTMTVIVSNQDATYRLRVTNRAKVALLSMDN